MDKFKFLTQKLCDLGDLGLLRQLKCIGSANGPIIKFDGKGEKVNFCSNNYLNISGDVRVASSVNDCISEYGYGACSSRLISGTMTGHVEVEKAFSNFYGTESALLFNSGWSANEALLTTLPSENDLILIDKLDHASIVDAVKSSAAAFRTFRRSNYDRLEKYLADNDYDQKYIVTESVFSMDGACADLKRLVDLKYKYDAILVVDEAHGIGCMGDTGAGLTQQLGLIDDVDIIVAPLGKAFAATGAVIVSCKAVTDYLINKARPFIYTTAPSPVNCAAILAAIEIIRTEHHRRTDLADNADYLRRNLKDSGFDTGESQTHIIPVIIGDAKETVRISAELFDKGFFATAIRPPTVSKGTSRLRLSVQSEHTKEQLDAFVKTLKHSIR